MKIIDKNRLLSSLEEIRQTRIRRNCSRETMRQADALAYVISVINTFPEVSDEELDGYLLEKINGENNGS